MGFRDASGTQVAPKPGGDDRDSQKGRIWVENEIPVVPTGLNTTETDWVPCMVAGWELFRPTVVGVPTAGPPDGFPFRYFFTAIDPSGLFAPRSTASCAHSIESVQSQRRNSPSSVHWRVFRLTITGVRTPPVPMTPVPTDNGRPYRYMCSNK